MTRFFPYNNQQKHKVGKYENGFKNGKWVEYDKKGWLRRITTYKNGKSVKRTDYTKDNSFTSE